MFLNAESGCILAYGEMGSRKGLHPEHQKPTHKRWYRVVVQTMYAQGKILPFIKIANFI
jgi:hypothetical protein